MLRSLLSLLLITLVHVAAAATASDADKLSASDLEIYRRAFDAAGNDKWADAREIASHGQNALAAKTIQWMDLVRPGPGRDFEEYQRFMRENPGWPSQSTLLAQAERAMPESWPTEEALRWFQNREPLTIAGTMQLARAFLARNQDKNAVATLRRGWVRLDMSSEDEATFLDRYRKHLRAQDHIARLDRLLWDENEAGARRMFRRVDAAHQALAEARLRLMSMDPGVEGGLRKIPRELLRDPGLLYERARWRRRKGLYEDIVPLLDPPPARNPYPEIVWPEKEDAARRALTRGDVSVAYRLAASHGENTDGPSFAEGEWLSGWIALRFLEDRKVAYEHFTRLFAGVTTSISQSRAAYWAGRAAEDVGELALAQGWYERAAKYLTSYYGQLAAHRLGRTDAMRFAPMPNPTKDDRDRFGILELVRVVRVLAQLGETDRARSFLMKLADQAKKPVDGRLVADLAAETGHDELVVAVAKAVRLKGTELIDYLYPLRPVPDGGGPEKAFVLAVVRQESAFSIDAVSPVGALGLMQLMPNTAKHIADALNVAFDKERLTDDPSYNIVLGRAYLDELIADFGGSYVLAIASYNAGPSRVAEWMRQFGDPRDYGVDVVDWIESIPFSETRNYVQRVLENLQVYRHRLGDKQVVLSLEQDLSRHNKP